MDWANHYLRKSGHSATLADLKDISDGQFLPQIIQAVGEWKRGREGGMEGEGRQGERVARRLGARRKRGENWKIIISFFPLPTNSS